MRAISIMLLLMSLLSVSCVTTRERRMAVHTDSRFLENISVRIESLRPGLTLHEIERALQLPYPVAFVTRFRAVTIYRSSFDYCPGYEGCSLTVEQNNQTGAITITYETTEGKQRVSRSLGTPKNWKRTPL